MGGRIGVVGDQRYVVMVISQSPLARCVPSDPTTLAAASLAYARNLAGHAPNDAICEVTVMSNHSLSAGCGMTAGQIRSGMLPDQNNGTFRGLVPDGVASVTLHFAAANGHPAHSVTAQVQVCAQHPEACLPMTLATQAKAVHSSGSGPTLSASPARPTKHGG